MTKVFDPNHGRFPLGRTPGEQQGWHQLARGYSAAVGNAGRHRIDSRADLKAYAIGVVGTASLILAQVQFEHGNRFADPQEVE